MNNKQIEEFVDILYPFFLKKMRNDGYFKNNVKMKNATVVSKLAEGESNINKEVEVIFPYDSTSFFVLNKTGVDLNAYNPETKTNNMDTVCIMYWIDLKNAVAIFKV